MAKQNGIIKIRGTVDNLSFFRTKNGDEVRRRRKPLSREEFATSPSYAQQRNMLADFQRLQPAVKLFRLALVPALKAFNDGSLNSRLLKAFHKVQVADATNLRGLKQVMDGDPGMLKGFNFGGGSLDSIFRVEVVSSIERADGKMVITLPAFVPEERITKPAGATHCRIISSGVDVNFSTGVQQAVHFQSAAIPLTNVEQPQMEITHTLAPASTNHQYLLLGINFYAEEFGNFYPLLSQSHNALVVIGAGKA